MLLSKTSICHFFIKYVALLHSIITVWTFLKRCSMQHFNSVLGSTFVWAKDTIMTPLDLNFLFECKYVNTEWPFIEGTETKLHLGHTLFNDQSDIWNLFPKRENHLVISSFCDSFCFWSSFSKFFTFLMISLNSSLLSLVSGLGTTNAGDLPAANDSPVASRAISDNFWILRWSNSLPTALLRFLTSSDPVGTCGAFLWMDYWESA